MNITAHKSVSLDKHVPARAVPLDKLAVREVELAIDATYSQGLLSGLQANNVNALFFVLECLGRQRGRGVFTA